MSARIIDLRERKEHHPTREQEVWTPLNRDSAEQLQKAIYKDAHPLMFFYTEDRRAGYAVLGPCIAKTSITLTVERCEAKWRAALIVYRSHERRLDPCQEGEETEYRGETVVYAETNGFGVLDALWSYPEELVNAVPACHLAYLSDSLRGKAVARGER
jgi:hypothetical protein